VSETFRRRLVRAAAIVYAVTSAVAALFQLAIGAGAPWGTYTMGGRFPGTLPPAMRLAAIAQALLIVAMALVVLARAGVTLISRARRRLVWAVVAFNAVSLLLNLITPSTGERALWAPVAAVLLVTSTVVASAAPTTGDRG
jgi:hypothetical protein